MKKVSIITIVLIVILVIRWHRNDYVNSKVLKTPYSITNTKSNALSYVDVKNQSLNNFDKELTGVNIQVVVFEFSFQTVSHSLIIRQDKFLQLISTSFIDTANHYSRSLSESYLLDILHEVDGNFSHWGFKDRVKRKFLNKKNGILIYVRTSDGETLELAINSLNYKDPIFSEVLNKVPKLISEILHQQIELTDLIKT